MRSAQLLVTSWIVASPPDEALTTSSAIDQKLSPAFTTLVPSIDVDGSSPIVPGVAGPEGVSSSLSREVVVVVSGTVVVVDGAERSEEHTSELQSLMRISYAVFCLKKKKIIP